MLASKFGNRHFVGIKRMYLTRVLSTTSFSTAVVIASNFLFRYSEIAIPQFAAPKLPCSSQTPFYEKKKVSIDRFANVRKPLLYHSSNTSYSFDTYLSFFFTFSPFPLYPSLILLLLSLTSSYPLIIRLNFWSHH
jgi:hypothetical protein